MSCEFLKVSMKKFLQLKHIEIYSGNQMVYSQAFKMGLNVIAGENSTGKSTIIDFIAHVLGYEEIEWKAIQRKCTHVIAHFCIDNAHDFLLKREINDKKQNSIHFKNIDESSPWIVLPYKNSNEKKSFSSHMFELIGIPTTKLDENSSLTMFHALRLIYADQSTSADSLLNRQKEFDNKSIRRSFSEVLLGVDDFESHRLRQKLSEYEKIYNNDKYEVQAINRFLEEWGLQSPGEISSLIRDHEKIINEELKRIKEIDLTQSGGEIDDGIRTKIKQNSELNFMANSEIEMLKIEIKDSEELINLLNSSKSDIDSSMEFYSIFSGLEFLHCPQCLHPLHNRKQHENGCLLCNEQLPKTNEVNKFYLDRKIELEFQIRESKAIIEKKRAKILTIQKQIDERSSDNDAYSRQLKIQKTLNNKHVQAVAESSIKIGESNEKISQLKLNEARASKLEKMSQSLREIKGKIGEIKEEINQLTDSRYNYKSLVQAELSTIVRRLLKQDEGYETAFINSFHIELDFENSIMSVDGVRKFSDSSEAILKASSRFAIFYLSTLFERVRIPRFSIIDCMEDKGMRPERAALLQNAMLDELAKINGDYQLIIGTSMPSSRIIDGNYILGKYLNKGDHTLQLDL